MIKMFVQVPTSTLPRRRAIGMISSITPYQEHVHRAVPLKRRGGLWESVLPASVAVGNALENVLGMKTLILQRDQVLTRKDDNIKAARIWLSMELCKEQQITLHNQALIKLT